MLMGTEQRFRSIFREPVFTCGGVIKTFLKQRTGIARRRESSLSLPGPFCSLTISRPLCQNSVQRLAATPARLSNDCPTNDVKFKSLLKTRGA